MEFGVPPDPAVYRFYVCPKHPDDPRSAGFLADAQALGLPVITGLQCHDIYFIEGHLSDPDLQRIAAQLLSDPLTQTTEWGRFIFASQDSGARRRPAAGQPTVEVALRPGVTDPVAEQILRACRVLGIPGVLRASTGQRFILRGEQLAAEHLHLLARRLLANPTIQRYTLGEIEPVFPHGAEASGRVEILPLRCHSPQELLALSQGRRAALDLSEMKAIQDHYRREGRDPTDVEFETIAQTWSEHCVHKTFKALIEITGESVQTQTIDGLLRTYIRSATEQISASWVRSAFVDNAGIIDFDEQFEISFKVETHNHPSAIEPFGGANTGVGGVIRDILGVSARPIAATDVLCFGPQEVSLEDLPEGVLHPRRIRSGVVAGVQDYGNKIGIPTVNGAILYDPGFIANPLVFCGCVGIAPKGSHPRAPRAGDRVIVIGGRTGRDGLRGATFSSMTMDGQTGEVAGASVQIGDPITEKGLIEVVVRARDLGLYHAVTDCGAGGLSSAVGEMSSQTGVQVDLKQVRLKYPGLAPWEVWLSEAQERMVLAVPEAALPNLQALCETFDVELTDIGVFTNSDRLVVCSNGQVVLDLPNLFLHDGIPQRRLTAILPRPAVSSGIPESQLSITVDPNLQLLFLLSQPNTASKADVIRLYDHEVQGGTVVKPLTGIQDDGPSDACVLKPLGASGSRGIVLANGINPGYGGRDPYNMAVSVIDEAIRNAVAVGADPEHIALLDNFCWGDPRRPETLGGLVEAARGCHAAALHYRTPFISGKDSLNNEYLGADGQRHAIPPTLLISAIGIIEDVSRAVTLDLKEPGNRIYLLGAPPWGAGPGPVPSLPRDAPKIYRSLHRAMQDRLVRACHDLSEGGLGVAVAEMCIAGRLGVALDLHTAHPMRALFGETNGCLLAEVRPADCPAFEAHFGGLPVARIGAVVDGRQLVITNHGVEIVSLSIPQLVAAWQRSPAASPGLSTPHGA